MFCDWKKIGLFSAGVLFGTAGIKILSSDDAKKCYTGATAAALRAQDCVLKVKDQIQENCNDILSDAREINEKRAQKKAASIISETE